MPFRLRRCSGAAMPSERVLNFVFCELRTQNISRRYLSVSRRVHAPHRGEKASAGSQPPRRMPGSRQSSESRRSKPSRRCLLLHTTTVRCCCKTTTVSGLRPVKFWLSAFACPEHAGAREGGGQGPPTPQSSACCCLSSVVVGGEGGWACPMFVLTPVSLLAS